MQYTWSLDRVKVFTVDCGEKEMVMPDSLMVEKFPTAAS